MQFSVTFFKRAIFNLHVQFELICQNYGRVVSLFLLLGSFYWLFKECYTVFFFGSYSVLPNFSQIHLSSLPNLIVWFFFFFYNLLVKFVLLVYSCTWHSTGGHQHTRGNIIKEKWHHLTQQPSIASDSLTKGRNLCLPLLSMLWSCLAWACTGFMHAERECDHKNKNKSSELKISKTKLPEKNKLKGKSNKRKKNMWFIFCWPNTFGNGFCSGIWMIYSVALHSRVVFPPLLSGVNYK